MFDDFLYSLKTPNQLIEALIENWSDWEKNEDYYLSVLVPSIVAGTESKVERERMILDKLRPLLNDNEWKALPQLIAEVRKGNLLKVEGERLKREEQEKERKKAELERFRQEYIRKQVEERRKELLAKIDNELQTNFLSAEEFYKTIPSNIISYHEFKTRKLDFVRKWFVARNKKMERAVGFVPDSEQVEVIATVNGHVQVVARAGSGKTATLVNRALFLIEHCKADPSSMLIMAFNRKAAIEIRRRLLVLINSDAENQIRTEINKRRNELRGRKGRIDQIDIEADSINKVAKHFEVKLPHIMTFHALAYALVHPEESMLYNDIEGDHQLLNRVFQRIIDDYLQIPEYKKKIQEIMMQHFKDDWDNLVKGKYNLSQQEFLQFKRSMPRETLQGEYVKSYGEKMIADFLFEHDIKYNYEKNYWWNGINYRPDFTVYKTSKTGVIIEYFGLEGNPDYDNMSEQKRQYWAKNLSWDLIEFSPSEIRKEEATFKELIKAQLETQGIVCNRLSEEEIWLRIRDRAIDRFTKSMVSFIGRCRKLSMSPEDLLGLINVHEPLSLAEQKFLPLAQKFYAAYLDRLSSMGEEDFDGLMQRAAKIASNGVIHFRRKVDSGNLQDVRFIFIDEFQDFSDLFYQLLECIRKINPCIQLFCVGDDWQAINSFAGSDLRFFEQFKDFFGVFSRLYISTNYRSAKSIVNFSNILMTGLGKSAVAYKKTVGKVILADSSSFEPSAIEKSRHPGDIITPMISRIALKYVTASDGVTLLSRMKFLPWYISFHDQLSSGDIRLQRYIDLGRSLFGKDIGRHIDMSTVHGYKGLEKSTVIIVDAVSGRYPLIHPDWVFTRIFGDNLMKVTQDERRLFYVALTRAIENLVIITDSQVQSPLLDELLRIVPVNKIKWDDYPVVNDQNSLLIINVGNQKHRGIQPTYAIKDQLKACGYQWQSTGRKGWVKTCLAEGFQLATIKNEVWAEKADGIEVRVSDESDNTFEVFMINKGSWIRKE